MKSNQAENSGNTTKAGICQGLSYKFFLKKDAVNKCWNLTDCLYYGITRICHLLGFFKYLNFEKIHIYRQKFYIPTLYPHAK